MAGLRNIILLLSLVVTIHGLRTRIHRGSTAPEGRYPYQVSLQTAQIGHICGGSIINKRWILTAAHCVKGKGELKVVIGSTSRLQGTVYEVEKSICHENFVEIWDENDISLIRVKKDIEFNDKVQPVQLAQKYTRIDDGEYAVMTGWGRIEDYSTPERLQMLVVRMYGSERCKMITRTIVETEICTFASIRNATACMADSGGPIVNKNGIQVGIISHRYVACGRTDNPDIHTRVSSFRDWIDEKIAQN